MTTQDHHKTPEDTQDNFRATVRFDPAGTPHVSFHHKLTARQRQAAGRAGLIAATNIMMSRRGLLPGTPRDVHAIAPGGLPGPFLAILTVPRQNGHLFYISDHSLEPDASIPHVEIGLTYVTDLDAARREPEDSP